MSGDSDKQHQLLYYPENGKTIVILRQSASLLDSLALATPLLALRSPPSSLCHIRPHRSGIIDRKH